MSPCPLCGSDSLDPLGQGFLRCTVCNSAVNTLYRPDTYSSDYFTDDYLRQYGRTYEDDFNDIYLASCNRMGRIIPLLHKPLDTLSLFEIGSAMGFFLSCARDQGIADIHGSEISAFAVKRCYEKFGITVSSDPFSMNLDPGRFSIIAAWYVLEHFPDPGILFKHLYGALEKGGVLAFSLPAVWGPLFTRNRKEWFRLHPGDHRIDVDPDGLRRFLHSIGFRRVVMYPAGFHPERMIPAKHPFFFLFKPFYRLWSRLTCFSDTIECYAVK